MGNYDYLEIETYDQAEIFRTFLFNHKTSVAAILERISIQILSTNQMSVIFRGRLTFYNGISWLLTTFELGNESADDKLPYKWIFKFTSAFVYQKMRGI